MSRLTTQGTDLQQVVIRFVDAYVQDAAVAVTGHGLTPTQAKLMALLEEPMPMRSIADRLFCDASNVTGLVDRLEARGLVRREANPLDRRVKLVLLTDAGKRLVKQIRAEQYGLHDALGSLDPAAANQLEALLERMIPPLTAPRGRPQPLG